MNLPTPNKEAFLSSKPYPHCEIDDVFNPADLRMVLKHWPTRHENITVNGFEQHKGSTLTESGMGEYIAEFIKINFQSQEFIYFLEELTGIKGLVFDCRKFALHETFRGGALMPHLDYTESKVTGLQLRVNVLLYLNMNWKREYNGELDLYEGRPGYQNIPAASIQPLFNRLAIFTTNAETPAWHGHPKPLNCPEGMSRKSIALNYFSIPQSHSSANRTVFSNEKEGILKQFVPPILIKTFRRLKQK